MEADDAVARAISGMLKTLQRRQSGVRAGRARNDSMSSPIQLYLSVLDVWSAEVKAESFWAKMLVRARWECPSEHADEAMRHGSDALDADWEPEWFPKLTLDCMAEKFDEVRSFHAEQLADGKTWIAGEWRFAARILEAFDLHAFPFDVQDFNIVVRIENAALGVDLAYLPGAGKRGNTRKQTAAGHTAANVPACIEADALELPDFRTLRERQMDSGWLEKPALYRRTAEHDGVHVVLLFQRNPTFYVVNSMILLFAITSLAAFSWAVPWQQVADRLALDVTLLLTSVAFKQVLAGMMPPIAYLTRLDAYVLICLGFLLLATAMHGTIGFVIESCDIDSNCTFLIAGFAQARAVLMDTAFLAVYLGLWLLANLLYGLSVLRRIRRGRSAFSLSNARTKGFEPARIQLHRPSWFDDRLHSPKAAASESVQAQLELTGQI